MYVMFDPKARTLIISRLQSFPNWIEMEICQHGGNCGNPEGVYAYSSSAVRAYRESYVTAKTVPAKERWNAIHHTM